MTRALLEVLDCTYRDKVTKLMTALDIAFNSTVPPWCPSLQRKPEIPQPHCRFRRRYKGVRHRRRHTTSPSSYYIADARRKRCGSSSPASRRASISGPLAPFSTGNTDVIRTAGAAAAAAGATAAADENDLEFDAFLFYYDDDAAWASDLLIDALKDRR